MRNLILTILVVLVCSFELQAEKIPFTNLPENQGNKKSLQLNPDKEQGYFLYHTASNTGSDSIHVAHSNNSDSWTILGTAIEGSTDPV